MIILKKETISNIEHWAIFILVSLTLTLKIVEASSISTLEVIKKNPNISQYSRLVQTGYLFER
jgi:uncharacterized protein (UPF0147 family)